MSATRRQRSKLLDEIGAWRSTAWRRPRADGRAGTTRDEPRGTYHVREPARTWHRRVGAFTHATSVPPRTRAVEITVRKQGPAGTVNREDQPTKRQASDAQATADPS